jgi:heme exporter protein C
MPTNRLDRWIRTLNWLSLALVVICLLMIFFYAPTERTMGYVQRIFYFHVGSAWVASAAFFVALLSGLFFLLTSGYRPAAGRQPRAGFGRFWHNLRSTNAHEWDTIAVASIEIGLVFVTMTILSGSIWGRPAWNTWWIWSPRLTSITVLWLVYAAYFMLRGAVEDEERRGRFSAVYAILGFVTVIITFYSIRLLRDIHPARIGSAEEAQGEQELTGAMIITLNMAVITFTALYAAWLLNRIRLQRLTEEVNALKARVSARLHHQ